MSLNRWWNVGRGDAHAALYLEGLRSVCDAVLPRWARHVQQCREHGRSAVAGLECELDAVRRMLAGVESSSTGERVLLAAVRAEAERLLVELRFQERIDHMLSALDADITRLNERLRRDAAEMAAGRCPRPIDAAEWLHPTDHEETLP